MRLADDLMNRAVNMVAFNAQPVSGSGVPDLRGMVPDICAGCPYAASYYALRVAERRLGGLEVEVYGDLDCPNKEGGEYFPPETGLKFQSERSVPIVAVIGDPSILRTKDAATLASNINKRGGAVIVLDNELTGVMRRSKEVALALNVRDIRVVSSFDLDGMVDAILGACGSGPSVILSRQPCHVLEVRHGRVSRFASTRRFQVDESCTGCKHCLSQLGCPALESLGGMVRIDYSACVGCGVCASVCPNGSIREAEP